jgi:hypothetical protein
MCELTAARNTVAAWLPGAGCNLLEGGIGCAEVGTCQQPVAAAATHTATVLCYYLHGFYITSEEEDE